MCNHVSCFLLTWHIFSEQMEGLITRKSYTSSSSTSNITPYAWKQNVRLLQPLFQKSTVMKLLSGGLT